MQTRSYHGKAGASFCNPPGYLRPVPENTGEDSPVSIKRTTGVDTEIIHVVADVTNTKCITVLNDRPVIALYVVIKNSVTINLLHHSRIHLNEHATNVLYDPAGKHDIVFPGKGNYAFVIFHFPVTYVHRLMEFYPELRTLQTGIDNARPAVLGEKNRFAVMDIIETINELLQYPQGDDDFRIFLDTRAQEILLRTLRTFKKPVHQYKEFSPEELEKIYQAKQILEENYQDPPNYSELLHRIKWNKKYLNWGFQQIYDTTVYGYLFRFRMQKAKALLEAGKMDVLSVALEVGYKDQSAFTRAFKTFYEYLPSAVKGSRHRK